MSLLGTTRHAIWTAFVFGGVVLACQRETAPAPTASSAALTAPSASASAAPAAPKPWYEGKWSGKYTSALNRIELEAGGVKDWKLDDGGVASGEGKIELAVDAEGVARGKAEGPLGSLAVIGSADEDTLRLSFEPGAPSGDKDFRGMLVAKRDGAALRGTLRASSGDSLTVRVAEVELARAEP